MFRSGIDLCGEAGMEKRGLLACWDALDVGDLWEVLQRTAVSTQILNCSWTLHQKHLCPFQWALKSTGWDLFPTHPYSTYTYAHKHISEEHVINVKVTRCPWSVEAQHDLWIILDHEMIQNLCAAVIKAKERNDKH